MSDEAKLHELWQQVVTEMLDGNPAARAALTVMKTRGLSEQEARDELQRVVMGCVWLAAHGHEQDADLELFLTQLEAGHSAEQLFAPWDKRGA